MKPTQRLASLLILWGCAVNAALPSDSVYQHSADWQDQNQQKRQLASFGGKKLVVAMIYTHCLHTCPIIVSSLKSLQTELAQTSSQHRDNYHFVLVSLTTGSDTPETLKAFAKRRELDDRSWSLLSGRDSDVRTLAMLLGVKYKTMADNELAHSNVFTVLDEQGRIVMQRPGTLEAAKQAAKELSQNQ